MSPIRYLFWKVYREAGHLADQAAKILNHQRDQLSEKNIAETEAAIARLQEARRSGSKDDIRGAMKALEDSANIHLLPYPSPGIRENLEGFMTMALLLFAFRQFFFQPMVIPTGSAQPTFNGITAEDLRYSKNPLPNAVLQKAEWLLFGYHYYELIATQDGEFNGVGLSRGGGGALGLLSKDFDVQVGNVVYRIATSMSDTPEDFKRHMCLYNEYGTMPQRFFKAGEPIIRCRVKSGDRLFVDRITYNFRPPQRGETVVFKSLKHPGMTPNTHYIKRLIALGGERVKIGDDRHVYIDGKALDSRTPGFEHVYSFDPSRHPASSIYSGHVNGIGFAEGHWFSKHESEYALLRSSDPLAADKLKTLVDEKEAIWRGFTNSALAPTTEPLRSVFMQQKLRLEAASHATGNFPDSGTELTVRPGHVLCFGDNTMNSSDSRMWSVPDFPEERIVGKSGWVFWPLSSRWGWSQK